MIGQLDNSQRQFSPASHALNKVPFYIRVRGRLRGRRPLLYSNAGLHLRLPKPYDHIVYVYIRKNGCSAFKRWFLHDMRERRGTEADISIVAKKYAISMEWELARSRRLLVLRDPVERMCSLYRNKFIQRKGAEDILRSFEDSTGIQARDTSFKCFVEKYLSKISETRSSADAAIDPHCFSQAYHLWPTTYDHVVMMDDLPEVSRDIFSEEVATSFFQSRVNSTPTTSNCTLQSDTPASHLIDWYESQKLLPDNACLVDEESRNLIRRIYKNDYDLISQALKSRGK
jgi:hypothetical protein